MVFVFSFSVLLHLFHSLVFFFFSIYISFHFIFMFPCQKIVGSELDHKVKAAAADGEAAWHGPPKIGTTTGLWVWRIEKFQVKAWPRERYGTFFNGDSYIVLHSSGTDVTKLHHDAHIWIGSASSQDEYGTAAYKMVEADDFLGGTAVQHRQVEGNEDADFVALFDSLQYLDGGIETGFTHVEPTKDQPLFFQFSVRKDPNARQKKGELLQVPMTTASMDSSGAFILYADKSSVWAWHGKDVRWKWLSFILCCCCFCILNI